MSNHECFANGGFINESSQPVMFFGNYWLRGEGLLNKWSSKIPEYKVSSAEALLIVQEKNCG